MKNFKGKFNFIVVLFIAVSVLFACGKLKETVQNEVKKEETKQETTKKEETKQEEITKKEVTKSAEGRLYFCVQYKNGEEIGVSESFTPGWLTVMVDLRPSGRTLGTGKVELLISKIKNAAGDEISEKIIGTLPYDVQADWDYTYFTDKTKLKFSSPGTYKVVCQKTDGTPIVRGEVEIVPR